MVVTSFQPNFKRKEVEADVKLFVRNFSLRRGWLVVETCCQVVRPRLETT